MDCLLRLVIIQTPTFSKVRLSWTATGISRPSRIPLAQTFPACSPVGMFRIRYSGRQLRPPAQDAWQPLRRSVGWNTNANLSLWERPARQPAAGAPGEGARFDET